MEITSTKTVVGITDTSGSLTMTGNATIVSNVVSSIDGNIQTSGTMIMFQYSVTGSNADLTLRSCPKSLFSSVQSFVLDEETALNTKYAATSTT